MDVTLTDSSITAANSTIDIDNSGVFSSNTANALRANLVKLRQSVGGSIQNAISAVDATSNSTLLTLGAGTFDEQVLIDGRSNFILSGTGNSTTIKPTSTAALPAIQNGPIFGSEFYTPLVLVNNGTNVNVQNLTIDGSDVASPATAGLIYNNASGQANNLNLVNDGAYGMLAIASSDYGHAARTVTANAVQSSGNSSAQLAGIGNNLTFNVSNSTLDGTGAAHAIDYSNGTRGTFDQNTVTAGTVSGVSFHGAHDVNITNSTITGNNTQTGILDEGNAFGVADANNINIDKVIFNNVRDGIVLHGDTLSITNSKITGVNGNNGILLDGATGVNYVGKIPGGFHHGSEISGFDTGIKVVNSNGTNIMGNDISNVAQHGIEVRDSSDVLIRRNYVNSTGDNAIHAVNAENIVIFNNSMGQLIATYNTYNIHGDAIYVENSNGASIQSNSMS